MNDYVEKCQSLLDSLDGRDAKSIEEVSQYLRHCLETMRDIAQSVGHLADKVHHHNHNP